MGKMRISTENRTRLETVIPLATPFLIFIDPSNVCNLKCKFCPTGNHELLSSVGREPRIMEWALYRKIIDQCNNFPNKIKTLRLYKDGEPLINPHFTDMVWYAADKGYFKSIDTTTNGTLLSPKTNREIVLSGLSRINISVPVQYDERYMENIAHLHMYSKLRCEVFAKICGDVITPEAKEKFIEDFTPITDNCAIEHIAPCWPGFEVANANQEVGIYGQEFSNVEVCPYIFYSMAINADGTVSLCFLDWAYKNLIGDLQFRNQNIVDIWNSRLLRMIQVVNLSKKIKRIPGCSACQQLKYGMPDNIDKYTVPLLNKIDDGV